MRYFLIFFILVLFANCFSVPKEYLVNDDVCYYNDPIFNITKEELILNSKTLKQLQNKEDDLILIDDGKFKNRYYKFSDGEITNKQTNKQLNIGKWIRYRKNGTIKRVRFIYLNGTRDIKEEIHYDNQGNITKVIDYEKGYNICWAEAIAIVKKIAKKDIEKYEVTGFNLSHNNLNEFPNVKPEWQVTLDGNEEYKLKDVKVYRIDGVTGKFLRTTKITTSYD
ncbi:hypothetical protein [Tenacibaculum sp. SDUM215027]|uniref:hypothetical protein n=1 Tax=Tenacibaculum sp. SDUM215027 TaxID=3422596 RepID=UPI003D31BB54